MKQIMAKLKCKITLSMSGELAIHDYFGDGWGIFFTHPADYTPVCTTELSMVQKMIPDFTKRS